MKVCPKCDVHLFVLTTAGSHDKRDPDIRQIAAGALEHRCKEWTARQRICHTCGGIINTVEISVELLEKMFKEIRSETCES